MLVPEDKVIDQLLERLEVTVDPYLTEMRSAWNVHRRVVERQITLWRRFERGMVEDVETEVAICAQEHPILTLERDCYTVWTATVRAQRTRSSPIELAERLPSLYSLHRRILADSHHVPRHMRPLGDIRLRIVLTIADSLLASMSNRHQASFLLAARGQEMQLQLPRYWV